MISGDWSSDVCSSDLTNITSREAGKILAGHAQSAGFSTMIGSPTIYPTINRLSGNIPMRPAVAPPVSDQYIHTKATTVFLRFSTTKSSSTTGLDVGSNGGSWYQALLPMIATEASNRACPTSRYPRSVSETCAILTSSTTRHPYLWN